jgi:hypothetical protein
MDGLFVGGWSLFGSVWNIGFHHVYGVTYGCYILYIFVMMKLVVVEGVARYDRSQLGRC